MIALMLAAKHFLVPRNYEHGAGTVLGVADAGGAGGAGYLDALAAVVAVAAGAQCSTGRADR